MEELSKDICLLLESAPVNIKNVEKLLKDLGSILSKVTSRFVDIDTCIKDDLDLVQTVRANIAASVRDQVVQENLFQIYEVLKTYLGIKVKYGEAADWYLKESFFQAMTNGLMK